MFFFIRHITRFSYDRPVFTEPTVVRLRPREDPTQKLHRFSMHVAPPAGRTDGIDLFGNPVSYLWFEGVHADLTIQTNSVIQTFRKNPFDFLISPVEAAKTPFIYSDLLRPMASAYLQRLEPCPEVDEWTRGILSQSGGKTVPFLSNLCESIHAMVLNELRHEGSPYTPCEMLSRKSGACRDVAVLFIDACRSLGIASRFVSGYWEGTPDRPERELHAWAEVYLPGAGWRGYDPSQGIAVADEHVALAAAPEPLGASPTHGTFRGNGASSSLNFEIEILSADSKETLESRISNLAPARG